ncbi:MAG: hypothetical protein IKJ74_06310 [Clostridia bacterium]|nr:hypothetical protein [Clostridia bacterium]
MNMNFYREIKSIFISARFSFARKISKRENEEKFEYFKGRLIPFFEELNLHIRENNNDILVYCIEMLLRVISEGDSVKVNAFADTIHNMPEICMNLRPLHTFYGEISGFRAKYGSQYFPFFDQFKVTEDDINE